MTFAALFFDRRAIALILTLMALLAPARAQTGLSAPPLPEKAVLDSAVKSMLAAFNHANLTGDYSVLHKLSAPEFQRTVSLERLFSAFKGFRDQGINIEEALIRDIEYTEQPRVDSNGLLHLIGKIETRPSRTKFNMQFRILEGRMRLYFINVSVAPAD